MMKRLFTAFSAMLAACLVIGSCTNGPVSTGGTETGDAVVIGTLYQPDGKTPAAGIRVAIRPRNTLADTAGFALGKRTADTASVVTDSTGRFSFDTTLDTGTYIIEAASGNDAVFIDSVVVTNKDLTDSLSADTLKPAGALKGVVKLSEGGDPRKIFVLAFGIDRFARVGVDGSFKFAGLAEGKYDLRLISSLDDYGVLDTVNIPVKSGDTLSMDTIDLPFTGIPTPKNVTINYDTLKQIVALSWSKAAPTLVNGYDVYRRNVDSNTVLSRINTSPITDTLYRDSTGIQDQTYEYRVAAVDKNATEGTKSAGVSVKVVGAFVFVDSIRTGMLQKVRDFIIRRDDRIFVSDDTTGLVIYNSNAIYQTTIACSSFSQVNLKRVFQMVEDGSGNLYITGVKDQVYGGKGIILKISPQDSLLLAFGYNGGTDSALGFPMGITISDTFVYVENTDDRKIKVFSSNTGTLLFSFGGAGSNQGQFVEIKGMSADQENHIWVLEEKRIQEFDQRGIIIGAFAINIGVPNGLNVTNEGEIFTFSATNGFVFGFSNSGIISSKFKPNGLFSALLFIDNSNDFYLSNTSYSTIAKFR